MAHIILPFGRPLPPIATISEPWHRVMNRLQSIGMDHPETVTVLGEAVEALLDRMTVGDKPH